VRYLDRADAGLALARLLTAYRTGPPVRVLGIARGGVKVAAPIAQELRRPLDVLVIRKLGLPWAPEVAFGAIGPYGVDIRAVEAESHLAPDEADAIAASARIEVDRQVSAYRHGRPPLDLTGETAILVDDGLATGATAQAAVALARELRAARVVIAVPVGAARAITDLRLVADDVVCPIVPRLFDAVSRYYERFGQVDDDEVMALLVAARARA
jgi:predicted phosphoribosyltransferase